MPPPDGPPAPVLASIEISGPAIVNEQEAAQFTCTAEFSDGTTSIVDPVWSDDASFGSINSSGEFVSADLIADSTATITAEYDGEVASVTITVVDSVPSLISLSISGPASVDEETTAQFNCVGHYSDDSILAVTPGWSVSSTAAMIGTDGLLTAGNVAADVDVTVTASFGGRTATADITVKYVAPVVTGIMITGGVSMNEETTLQLGCVAVYSDDSTTTVSPSWSDNSGYASVNGGLVTAGDVLSDQTVVVTANYEDFSDTHSILIKYVAPTLSSISISGPSAVQEEGSAQYTCTAHYSDNTSETVPASWGENSTYASINASGELTTGNVTSDKTFTVSASYGGKSSSMSVSILYVEPDLESLVISGATSVDEGESTRYTCEAFYTDDTSKSVTPVWSVNSSNAVIGADGLLTARDIAVDEIITVTASLGGVQDTFAVTLKYVPPPVVVNGLWIEGPVEMDELGSISLTCYASFSDNTTNTVDATWAESSSRASVTQGGVLKAGNFDADGTISVGASYGGYSASHEVAVSKLETTITYPLEGLEDKTVISVMYEHGSDSWTTHGPHEDGEVVFEHKGERQWYWVSIQETNTVSGETSEIQAGWFHL